MKVTSLFRNRSKTHQPLFGAGIVRAAKRSGPSPYAALLERGGRRWVSFLPAGPGAASSDFVKSTPQTSARRSLGTVLALAEKELGLISSACGLISIA